MEAQRGLYSFFLGSSGGSGDICKGSDGGDNCRNGSREGGWEIKRTGRCFLNFSIHFNFFLLFSWFPNPLNSPKSSLGLGEQRTKLECGRFSLIYWKGFCCYCFIFYIWLSLLLIHYHWFITDIFFPSANLASVFNERNFIRWKIMVDHPSIKRDPKRV